MTHSNRHWGCRIPVPGTRGSRWGRTATPPYRVQDQEPLPTAPNISLTASEDSSPRVSHPMWLSIPHLLGPAVAGAGTFQLWRSCGVTDLSHSARCAPPPLDQLALGPSVATEGAMGVCLRGHRHYLKRVGEGTVSRGDTRGGSAGSVLVYWTAGPTRSGRAAARRAHVPGPGPSPSRRPSRGTEGYVTSGPLRPHDPPFWAGARLLRSGRSLCPRSALCLCLSTVRRPMSVCRRGAFCRRLLAAGGVWLGGSPRSGGIRCLGLGGGRKGMGTGPKCLPLFPLLRGPHGAPVGGRGGAPPPPPRPPVVLSFWRRQRRRGKCWVQTNWRRRRKG